MPKTRQRANNDNKTIVNILDKHRCKNLQQVLAKQIQQHKKKIIHIDQVRFIPMKKG
jgi:anti-anti-sigma regulatory factor